MTLHAHLLFDPDAEALALLRSLLDENVTVTAGEELAQTAVSQTAVPHVLVAGRLTRELLQRLPGLRAVVVPWAGIPGATRDLLRDFPHVAAHNLHHNAIPVAETVLTLLLAAAKFTVPFDRALRRNDWTPRYARPRPTVQLAGKTAVILGYGAIGQRVGRLLQALEMRVLATRRSQSGVTQDDVAAIYPAEALPDLLPQANALIVCLPLTPQTEGLIGAAELALLPQPAILVNIGRGPIVEQRALYEALRDGRLHAAGLDVWYNYPADETSRGNTPPADYPFHELDNVVMSPHRGGGADDSETLRMTHLADLLNAAARGEEMPNRVDLEAGY